MERKCEFLDVNFFSVWFERNFLGKSSLIWVQVLWLWVYGSITISWIYGFDLLEVSMLNVLVFSVLRLIMNVGWLGLS